MAPKDITREVGALIATMESRRTDATAAQLLEAARTAKYWISADNRIGEADAAKLLGMTPTSLANKRREGKGPSAYALGGGGHKVTYRLIDLAKWIESHREWNCAA
jgi:hypothetical protein